MLQRSTRALPPAFTRRTAIRAYSSHVSSNEVPANAPNPTRPTVRDSSSNELSTSSRGNQDRSLQESLEAGEQRRIQQAPNRATIWSRSQQPRSGAMVGPRFEQTIIEDQPRPYAAIELIHKQPVRWTKERAVSCDGGGGPLGHPRIFINVDKPQIAWCTYCGVPYVSSSCALWREWRGLEGLGGLATNVRRQAHEHHREYLESLPSTSYPLGPSSDPAALPDAHLTPGKTGSTEQLQSNTGRPLEQR
jgi:NADH dehydrogenase (ubiquinone) Fe-S protein 6